MFSLVSVFIEQLIARSTDNSHAAVLFSHRTLLVSDGAHMIYSAAVRFGTSALKAKNERAWSGGGIISEMGLEAL